MKGLFFWVDSYCRSTLAFYKGLGKAFNVPSKFVIFIPSCNNRQDVGFSDSEFSDLDITYYDDINDVDFLMRQYKDYHHFFCVYQKNNGCRELLLKVKSYQSIVSVISEAPCNMDHGIRRFLKRIYIKYVLPQRVTNVIKQSDFIINLSGDDKTQLNTLGWSDEKIVSCGYYPPPIVNSIRTKRSNEHWKKFSILLTGIHTHHRSPLTLLNALYELDKLGMKYECYITQEGPLLNDMHNFVREHNMNSVHFLGFVSMDRLIELYQTCSIYIGAGSDEPWGMRLNDALNCGAPLIVSEGMGGCKLVRDYGCGFTFPRNDYKELSRLIERLIEDKDVYNQIAEKAYMAGTQIEPDIKAHEIVNTIRKRFPSWN